MYHGVRRILKLYSAQPAEVNILSATAVSLLPLVFTPSFRPMIPYGILLIGLDAVNDYKNA